MLKFIGTGSAFNTKLGNTSAYIKEDGVLFLIDCGELIFDRILRMGLLDDVKEVHITLTHTHPDHVGSLGSLIFYLYWIKNITPTFYAADLGFITLLQHMDVDSTICKFIINTPDKINPITNTISLTFIPVPHKNNINSFGLLIQHISTLQISFYSGDSSMISQDIINLLLYGGINNIYQDTCGSDYENNPHLSLTKLTELIPIEFRHKVYCMHLDEQFDTEKAKSLGFNVASNELNLYSDADIIKSVNLFYNTAVSRLTNIGIPENLVNDIMNHVSKNYVDQYMYDISLYPPKLQRVMLSQLNNLTLHHIREKYPDVVNDPTHFLRQAYDVLTHLVKHK